MRNVRQYYVDNEKVGKVFVIEGKVVNEFPDPKELVSVEAAIYDKDKKPLATKKQLGGVQLSLFQLQVLSEKEMESFLNNKVEILTNNTNKMLAARFPLWCCFMRRRRASPSLACGLLTSRMCLRRIRTRPKPSRRAA